MPEAAMVHTTDPGAHPPARGTAWPVIAGQLLVRSVRKWQTDRADRLSAALAFYALFSLAPLLVIGSTPL